MHKGKFLCVGSLPVLLCSLLLLVITALFELRDIEQKVKASAQGALSGEQHAWAKVETYNLGREVLITGSAPSQAAIDDAVRSVNAAYGVYRAKHNGEPLTQPQKQAPSFLLRLISDDEKNSRVELNGTLASQSDIDLVIAQTQKTFPNSRIINTLNLAPNISPVPDLNFFQPLKQVNRYASDLTVSVSQNRLALSGWVGNKSASLELQNQISRRFSGNIDNRVTVRNVCQELFNDLLQRGKINYEVGKATIAASSYPLLDQINQAAQRCPTSRFEVAGHSDSVGNLAFNTKLSQARAQAVVDYLVAKGRNKQQFIAKGYGPSRPIADNDSDDGRARNRRIEFEPRD